MRNLRKKKSSHEKLTFKEFEKDRRYRQRILKRNSKQYSEKMDIHQYNFEVFNSSINWYNCTVCKKRQLVKQFDQKPCRNCHDFSGKNDMDPGEVPDVLRNLTFVERQLISRIHPIVSLYKVKNCQYRYKGHIINLPQDVQEVADVLPLSPNSLRSILTFRMNGSEGFIDFQVRRQLVLNALIWLKANNPFYKDIIIDQERLIELPQCGSVFGELTEFTSIPETQSCDDSDIDFEFSDSEDSAEENADDCDCEDECDGVDSISYTDVPNLSYCSQKSQIQNAFGSEVSNWPTIGKMAINEFNTPGYLTMAFPTLFPYGTADISIERKKKITISKYAQHLMNFHDQRFCRDERFRYYIMNSQMRWDALNVGSVVVQKNEIFSKMTVIQLKDHIKANPSLIKKIMFYSSRIRTTRPYWNSRCSELLDMVFQNGDPTVFFSLSSADLHWPDIYRLLGLNVVNLTYKEKSKILSENPLLFDTFFVMRARFFVEHCFLKKFNVSDFWYRFEFQHRGSIHLHGVAWFKDAPSTKNPEDPDVQKIVLDYFDKLISCDNPNPEVPSSLVHPCQKRLSEISDENQDLAELVNTLQRHTVCSTNHCLRRKNGRKHPQCRYGFPKKLCSETSLEICDGEIKDINFKRNDDRVNKYNTWILRTWRANMDLSPISCETAILRYIAKYASKSESKSSTFNSLIRNVTSMVTEDNVNCKKLIRKILIGTCAERDYSAQEVIHYLMSYGFYHCSREFVVLNLKQLIYDCYGKRDRYISVIEKYVCRPSYLDCYSLYFFARNFSYRNQVVKMRMKPAIVRIFPKPILTESIELDQNLISTLFVFFCPWKTITDVANEGSQKNLQVNERMDVIRNVLSGRTIDEVVSHFGDLDDNESFLNDFDDVDVKIKGKLDPLSNFHPCTNTHRQIGNRKIDRSHDWCDWDCAIQQTELNNLYTSIVSDFVGSTSFDIGTHKLTGKQNEILLQVKNQIQLLKVGTEYNGCVTFIQGGAGTGKSYVLKCMFNLICSCLGSNFVKILGSTGISAKNVNGETIHSFLKLGRKSNYQTNLVGDELVKFQRSRMSYKFLLVDEYSMIGTNLFAAMEYRIQQMADNEYFFGNLFVYFFGDCNQLPPVGDTPLFSNFKYNYSSALGSKGKMLVHNIDSAFVLDHNYRATCKDYSSFLESVANGTCTSNDSKELRRRCFTVLSRKEQSLFKTAIRICSTNELVDSFNNDQLEVLGKPVAIMKSENSSKLAFNSTDSEADGLQNVIHLCVGAKVMLRRNLNVSRGLVNGAIGVVKAILYISDKPPSLPTFVLVHFDNVNLNDFGVDFVPLRPVLSSWMKKKVRCTRLQVPISLAWACTIHKSQSLGFKKVVLELAEREYTIGLLYVALSRVSKFSDIALLTTVTLERLNSCRRSKYFEPKASFLSWLNSFNSF